MSAAKIAFIIVITVTFHVVVTPPTPSPSEREQVPRTKWEKIFLSRFSQLSIKFVIWALALAEITVIAKDQDQYDLRLTPTSLFGALLIITGGLIRQECYNTLGRHFTFERSIRDSHQLVTKRLYSIVRHPGYLGSAISYAGTLFWYGSRGSWLMESKVLETALWKIVASVFALTQVAIVVCLLARMSKEDEALRKAFGNKWEEWAKQVPYSIIPGIY